MSTRLSKEREAEIRERASRSVNWTEEDWRDDSRDLLAEIDALRKERDDLNADVTHAVQEAKRYEPDYPWTLGTVSECVWALGQGLNGVKTANDWLREENRKLKELNG